MICPIIYNDTNKLCLQIPAFDCELRVSGVCPNERYVFAVGAYTSDGKLVGDGVGESSRPILASHPLPVLMTWALLSQVNNHASHTLYVLLLLPVLMTWALLSQVNNHASHTLYVLPLPVLMTWTLLSQVNNHASHTLYVLLPLPVLMTWALLSQVNDHASHTLYVLFRRTCLVFVSKINICILLTNIHPSPYTALIERTPLSS